jgi:hypothetical protein
MWVSLSLKKDNFSAVRDLAQGLIRQSPFSLPTTGTQRRFFRFGGKLPLLTLDSLQNASNA